MENEKIENKPTAISQWNEFLKESPEFCAANPDDVTLPYAEPKNANQENTNAHHMLKAIIKKEVDQYNQKNADENFPDWTNEDQWKHYPVADMNPSSGSGFAYANCDCWHASTGCGSRLCTPHEELCENLFKKYDAIYEVWFRK